MWGGKRDESDFLFNFLVRMGLFLHGAGGGEAEQKEMAFFNTNFERVTRYNVQVDKKCFWWFSRLVCRKLGVGGRFFQAILILNIL